MSIWLLTVLSEALPDAQTSKYRYVPVYTQHLYEELLEVGPVIPGMPVGDVQLTGKAVW